MGKLDGKVAIVTGAGRGLGRAYALRLAGLGAKVAVTDLDLKSYAEFEAEAAAMAGDSTVDEINGQGGEAMGFAFDIGDRDAVMAMANDVQKKWGAIDILVANAGGGRGTPRETAASIVPQDLLELVTRMNFYGTVYSCSAVAPAMKAQRSGKIVTVASYAGSVAGAGGGYAHYGANKAAIAHYTRYLAQELGPFNINCNCIAPGVIQTARIVKLMGGEQRSNRQAEGIPLRRLGTVEDCAKVVEFLTTDLSDYVTGALIPIDGGSNRAG
ncbi:MAG TPA: SDR family NAD(P)-dependent oxidoreductase [Rhizomicrobium sp.]|jgi:3-oxoacyl-[acyl-carrier protein] reductase